jgi:hypothetical protein
MLQKFVQLGTIGRMSGAITCIALFHIGVNTPFFLGFFASWASWTGTLLLAEAITGKEYARWAWYGFYYGGVGKGLLYGIALTVIANFYPLSVSYMEAIIIGGGADLLDKYWKGFTL